MLTVVSTAVALWVEHSLFCEAMLDTTIPLIYVAALQAQIQLFTGYCYCHKNMSFVRKKKKVLGIIQITAVLSMKG